MPLLETSRGSIWASDQRDGRSPIVILIHGAGGSRLDWPAELRRLPDVGLIALDLPGHGKSPGSGRASVPEYAADVIALMDALTIDRAIFCGQSLGGAIALQLALDHPARAQGLLLLGTGAQLKVNPTILEGIRTDQAGVARLLRDWFFAKDTGKALRDAAYEALMNMNTETLYNDFAAANRFDVRDRLGEIRVPTLILVGQQDRMTPPRLSYFLHDHIAGSQLIELEGAGHKLHHEQAGAVAEAIARWIKENF